MRTAERYTGIDGLRAFAAIGIMLMHTRASTGYNIGGAFYNSVIPFFTNFVFLFMIISGFSMCCGYYERLQNGEISIEKFYAKRYSKILPFFSVLVLAELVLSPCRQYLLEAFADLTLCFSLLPSPGNMEVVGVGRTLGVIFLFYMLFPFFCFLLHTKKRAWLSFAAAVIYDYACTSYFFSAKFVASNFSYRSSFIYCAVFFIAGGIIYLYRKQIIDLLSKHRYVCLAACIAVSCICFLWDTNGTKNLLFVLKMVIIFSVWLIYAVSCGGRLLSNRVTKFVSSIGMEIYLSHMFAFRLIEKLGLTRLFDCDWLSYILTVCFTLGVTVMLIFCIRRAISMAERLLSAVKKKTVG